LKAAIENEVTGAEIELIKSSGGVFEISRNGQLIYSKKETGSFPEESDIVQSLMR